jgi:NAD-dependent DNA ligase
MKIDIPTHCPCCGEPLEFTNDQLFCVNSSCPAQLYKRVEHFTKTLGIKGFGAKTIEKLALDSIPEIYFLEFEDVAAAIGSERMAQKLLLEIESSRTASLDKVLAAFSIPLIGQTLSTRLCQVVKHIDEITAETCSTAGLGAKATANLINWLNTEFLEVREFLPFDFKASGTTETATREDGKSLPSVCITGKLVTFKTKAEATTALTAAGYKVVESVTKQTDMLVDEGDKGSTKRKRAEELGIPIITNLKDFLKETTK